MEIKWQKLIMKLCFWLIIEAVFSIIGIDDLADYSEFLLMPKVTINSEYGVAG
ncbi:MAG: hypothetical protein AAGF83_16195 [Cyanobacteria bacterium P01_G01_bin.67]